MSKESMEKRKERTKKIISKLGKKYPNATTALLHDDPLQLLVATILSAQCTDKKVNSVTAELFRKHKNAADFAKLPQPALEKQIRSTGFFRNKARNIRKSCKMIEEDFGGKVPDNMEDLVKLPGVSRKTANVVLANAFGKKEGIVVDTHVKRLSGRLKLTNKKDPKTIELDLMELVPKKHWISFPHMLIYHGRETCTSRKAKCETCIINDLCPSAFKV